MGERQAIKEMLKRYLSIGAIVGIVLAALFVGFVAMPETNASFFATVPQDEASLVQARVAFVLFVALVAASLFAWTLFLPLGWHVIGRAKNRLLSGWIVSCLLMIFIQMLYLIVVIGFGSLVGLLYLLYCLARLWVMKRREAVR